MFPAIWSNLRFRKYDHLGGEVERLTLRYDLVTLKNTAQVYQLRP